VLTGIFAVVVEEKAQGWGESYPAGVDCDSWTGGEGLEGTMMTQ